MPSACGNGVKQVEVLGFRVLGLPTSLTEASRLPPIRRDKNPPCDRDIVPLYARSTCMALDVTMSTIFERCCVP
eukprot:4299168-Pyramimonas_sp.AAC.1